MISAFEVYLVLQLDTIGAAVTVLAFGGVVGAVLRGVWAGFEDEPYGLIGYLMASFALMMIISAALIPSTKTAAAMIILPALTSDEVIQPVKKEAGELYDLAKQALASAVAEDKPVTDPPKDK